jgi:hypothetical protein
MSYSRENEAMYQKMPYGKYALNFLHKNEPWPQATRKEMLEFLIKYVDGVGGNLVISSVVVLLLSLADAEIPEFLVLPLGSAGVSLALNVGFHARSYFGGTMHGLQPAALAKKLNIAVADAETMLRGQGQCEENVSTQKYIYSANDHQVMMVDIYQLDQDDIVSLMKHGVHTPTWNLFGAIFVAALAGYLLELAGLGEVGTEFTRYLIAGTLGFVVTSGMGYASGYASNWYQRSCKGGERTPSMRLLASYTGG